MGSFTIMDSMDCIYCSMSSLGIVYVLNDEASGESVLG